MANALPDFSNALKVQKGEFNERVKRSLAQRAVGYTYRAAKITSYEGKVTMTEYDEHVPPDPGAAKIWLCNREPEEWRDKQHHEHGLSAEFAKFLEEIDGDSASLI